MQPIYHVRSTNAQDAMNHVPQDSKHWPHPSLALDESLDIEGVMAATGCTQEDFVDLAAIFLQEQANMTARLERACQAMTTHRHEAGWPEAVEQLRTAAHELTTPFGIVGARMAETYSRHTQLRTRKGSALADPPPTEEDLLTAASGLLGAVNRAAELLRRQP